MKHKTWSTGKVPTFTRVTSLYCRLDANDGVLHALRGSLAMIGDRARLSKGKEDKEEKPEADA